jgi:hypothetical protein
MTQRGVPLLRGQLFYSQKRRQSDVEFDAPSQSLIKQLSPFPPSRYSLTIEHCGDFRGITGRHLHSPLKSISYA